DKDDLVKTIVNSTEVGIKPTIDRFKIDIPLPLKLIGILAALTGILNIFIGSSLIPITVPFSLPLYGNTFIADPLVLCDNKNISDNSCQNLFQNKFDFRWFQEASNIMINGYSDDLSRRWGGKRGVVKNLRILMVAAVHNDSNSIYRLVKAADESYTIPAFGIITLCNGSIDKNEFEYLKYSNLTNLTEEEAHVNLIRAMEGESEKSKLEGRWIAEVVKLELDEYRGETTRITVNFVQILNFASLCIGKSMWNNSYYQLCQPMDNQPFVCYTNIHVENISHVKAACDNDNLCDSGGYSGESELNYSSPRPVYNTRIHDSLAIYGGHMLIPQCKDNSSE
ncbi:2224_t:CDS:1, partial [Racocetra fulgida]